MQINFSLIKNGCIFEDDFTRLTNQNGRIEFKRMRTSGGIAVVYAPNGTGKTSFSNLLAMEVSQENCTFKATDEHGNIIEPETKSFHVIHDQIDRNVIRGETTDYLIGAQIRREYELRDNINRIFKNVYENLASKYKKEFKISKVKDSLLLHLQSLQGPIYQEAFQYVRSIVNSKQRGDKIDREAFVSFVRNEENRLDILELNEEKKEFVISDLSNTKIIEKILSVNPSEVVSDTNIALVEQHDDAIALLSKYHSYDSCIVCDNPSFDGDEILERKKENRKNIYDNLDEKTKYILDNVVRDKNLSSSDPFEIKRIVGAFISGQNTTEFHELKHELLTYIKNIDNEIVDTLVHCFDDTRLFEYFDEYTHLVEIQPQLDCEELMFIENVINDNIGKDITIVRDENNDRNYKLKIGNKDLLGTDRKEMELSTGEQNFISLAFELLLARHSNKEYIIMDDPISSFDSVYKNKIAFCIIKFLENKKQIILTHNTDLIRLLDVQLNNCFNLYILNNVYEGENGFIPVSDIEKRLLINLHYLVAFFQNKGNQLTDVLHSRRQFLMAMIPFIRGYAHICLDKNDYYGKLSNIMHGYGTERLDIVPIYKELFGDVFDESEVIGVNDILDVDYNNLDIMDKEKYPLLADTLEQTLIYYQLRMKVEKELIDIFDIQVSDMMMLNQIIQIAFRCQKDNPNFNKMREFRVFFTSRKTLLNEFNHFEGNMNIFQPAIDITKSALQKEISEIENKINEIKVFIENNARQ